MVYWYLSSFVDQYTVYVFILRIRKIRRFFLPSSLLRSLLRPLLLAVFSHRLLSILTRP